MGRKIQTPVQCKTPYSIIITEGTTPIHCVREPHVVHSALVGDRKPTTKVSSNASLRSALVVSLFLSPLSPFIFVLALEVLSRQENFSQQNQRFQTEQRPRFMSMPSPKAASWSSQSNFANRDIIKKKLYATELGMVGILGSLKIRGFPLNQILLQS